MAEVGFVSFMAEKSLKTCAASHRGDDSKNGDESPSVVPSVMEVVMIFVDALRTTLGLSSDHAAANLQGGTSYHNGFSILFTVIKRAASADYPPTDPTIT